MAASKTHLCPAGQADLQAINRVIEAAVMTWDLPERVKRLSLPSYRYDVVDLDHLEIVLAEDYKHNIIGVAAWEQADSRDIPAGHKALSLHGIYVEPAYHRQAIGSQLFLAAEKAVCKQGFDGLLVKAQQGSNGFFISQNMEPLQAADPTHHYANRFWKSAALMLKKPATA
jgi:GNAT superfamily N-acetyltransferase